MSAAFQQFNKQNFLNLETYRKSQVAVKTPVWFSQEGDVLYIRTIDGSGKVKRIRNNSHVRIAPCRNNGELLGEWEDAQAFLAEGDEIQKANQSCSRKYGIQKSIFDLLNKIRRNNWATIVIKPA
jgi:PPOX class probable F420-dependent enzyme